MKAKEELAGIVLHGRTLRVDFSYTKKAHSPTPGKYLGKATARSRNFRGRDYGGSRYPSSYDYGYRGRSPPRRDYYDSRDRGYGGGGRDYDRYGGGGGGGGDRYSSYDRYDRGSYGRGPSSSYDDYDRRSYR